MLKLAAYIATGAVSGVGGGIFTVLRYKTAAVGEFLVKTGPFIRNVHLTRNVVDWPWRENFSWTKAGIFTPGIHVSQKTIQWPFQKIRTVATAPKEHHYTVTVASGDLVSFNMSMTISVAPFDPYDHIKGFVRFAKCTENIDEKTLESIINMIYIRETRKLASTAKFEGITNHTDSFTKHVEHNICEALKEYGLKIHSIKFGEVQKIQTTDATGSSKK